MNRQTSEFLLWIPLVSLILIGMPGQSAQAQSRPLPRAGFNNYSTGALPSGSGLHLQEGQDRPAGAPPGVYNPGEPKLNHKLVRWETRFMPLRVWISPGKKLVDEPISIINAQRPQEVLQLLNTDPTLSTLQKCRGWDEEMNAAAKSGIEQWKEFANEGLFSFVFVDDPTQANIFLFWTERFTGDESAGGVSTGGNTVAVLYDANEVHTREASIGQPLKGTPVIMELQVQPDSGEKLQARVAHEFGHALGIKEHSPYNEDLMCVNGIAKYLSPSDKATIRWLYRQTPAYVMLPPIVSHSAAPVAAAQQQQGWSDGNAGGSQASPGGTGTTGGGGYRVHFSKPNKPVPDDIVDQNTQSRPASYDSGARNNSDDSKKSKEKKSKHHKDSDEPETTAPAADTTPAPPREKASEGY